MSKYDKEDKPIDWVVLGLGTLFILVGIGAPTLLWAFGGLNISEWGFDSWQPYVSIICFIVYFALGKVTIEMRKDDET